MLISKLIDSGHDCYWEVGSLVCSLTQIIHLYQLCFLSSQELSLIFYANIVQANQTIFFPPGDTNVLTVFIAWLNLDFGFQTSNLLLQRLQQLLENLAPVCLPSLCMDHSGTDLHIQSSYTPADSDLRLYLPCL